MKRIEKILSSLFILGVFAPMLLSGCEGKDLVEAAREANVEKVSPIFTLVECQDKFCHWAIVKFKGECFLMYNSNHDASGLTPIKAENCVRKQDGN